MGSFFDLKGGVKEKSDGKSGEESLSSPSLSPSHPSFSQTAQRGEGGSIEPLEATDTAGTEASEEEEIGAPFPVSSPHRRPPETPEESPVGETTASLEAPLSGALLKR